MHIQLEANAQHAIQSYTDSSITLQGKTYERSMLISRTRLLTDCQVQSLADIDEAYIALLLELKPELVILGHNGPTALPPMPVIAALSKLGIGIETMTIGAACRTFNVLLNEDRAAVLGVIFEA